MSIASQKGAGSAVAQGIRSALNNSPRLASLGQESGLEILLMVSDQLAGMALLVNFLQHTSCKMHIHYVGFSGHDGAVDSEHFSDDVAYCLQHYRHFNFSQSIISESYPQATRAANKPMLAYLATRLCAAFSHINATVFATACVGDIESDEEPLADKLFYDLWAASNCRQQSGDGDKASLSPEVLNPLAGIKNNLALYESCPGPLIDKVFVCRHAVLDGKGGWRSCQTCPACYQQRQIQYDRWMREGSGLIESTLSATWSKTRLNTLCQGDANNALLLLVYCVEAGFPRVFTDYLSSLIAAENKQPENKQPENKQQWCLQAEQRQRLSDAVIRASWHSKDLCRLACLIDLGVDMAYILANTTKSVATIELFINRFKSYVSVDMLNRAALSNSVSWKFDQDKLTLLLRAGAELETILSDNTKTMAELSLVLQLFRSKITVLMLSRAVLASSWARLSINTKVRLLVEAGADIAFILAHSNKNKEAVARFIDTFRSYINLDMISQNMHVSIYFRQHEAQANYAEHGEYGEHGEYENHDREVKDCKIKNSKDEKVYH